MYLLLMSTQESLCAGLLTERGAQMLITAVLVRAASARTEAEPKLRLHVASAQGVARVRDVLGADSIDRRHDSIATGHLPFVGRRAATGPRTEGHNLGKPDTISGDQVFILDC